ncbi:MAG: hypothetical protein AAF750_16440 [Planctomycetota bacterium]
MTTTAEEPTTPSLLQRLRHTPLRHLILGRVSAALDWQRPITSSGLPDPVQSALLTLTRKTRLWRSERVAVATELTAHFTDGLDAGQSPDQLLEAFGPLQPAAKLIRRARKRNRPLWWKTQRVCFWLILSLIIFYLAALLYLLQGEPNPSVDYIAKLNAPAHAVPEADRAWPIYREAFIASNFHQLEIDPLLHEHDNGRLELITMHDPGWPDAVAFLQQHQPLLDALRNAGTKPGLGLIVGLDHDITGPDRLALFGPDRDPPLPAADPATLDTAQRLQANYSIAVLLPHLGDLRKSARLLAVDMRRAVTQEDADRWLANHTALLGFARHAREHEILINDLVAHSILSIAVRETAQTLHHQPAFFRDADLPQLAHQYADLIPNYQNPRLRGESDFMLDTLQRIYDDHGRVTYHGLRFVQGLDGFTTLTPNATANERLVQEAFLVAGLPLASVLMANRDEMQREHQRLMAMMLNDSHEPLWEVLRKASGVDEQIETWQQNHLTRIRYWPLLILMPALDHAARRVKQTTALLDALTVALALEAYQRDHAQYPDTLALLVPRYYPNTPLDHSTGQPLRYQLINDKPLLYGLGLNQQDNQGTLTEQAHSRWPRLPDQGDWILYPPPPPFDHTKHPDNTPLVNF